MQINSSFYEHLNAQHECNYLPTDKFLQNEKISFQNGEALGDAFGFGSWLGEK